MEVKDYIKTELDRIKQATMKALDGLSRQELAWRPGHQANSIGLVLFHNIRYEDLFVQTRVQGKPQVWESEKWHQKFNLPIGDVGSGYTAEQIAAFPVPEGKELLAYADVVRSQTLDYLQNMTPDGFDVVINTPRMGDIKTGAYLSHLLVHMAQHAGEMAYIRGLMRGMNR